MSLTDEEEEEYSPKWILRGLAVVLVVGLVGVGVALAVPLQPPLKSGASTAPQGTVIMPAGVGSNVQLGFKPASITVVIGKNNTVTFTNDDTTIHTVTANDGSFDSGNIMPGASWTYTFTSTGTFGYHCIYHHWMTGTITVVSS